MEEEGWVFLHRGGWGGWVNLEEEGLSGFGCVYCRGEGSK